MMQGVVLERLPHMKRCGLSVELLPILLQCPMAFLQGKLPHLKSRHFGNAFFTFLGWQAIRKGLSPQVFLVTNW